MTFSSDSNKIQEYWFSHPKSYAAGGVATKVKLLLADRSKVFCEGLVKLLESEPNVEVVGTCHTGFEAIEGAKEHRPDVILIDTELPHCSAITAMQHIYEGHPNTNIIVFTNSEADADLISAVRAGARAYISKDVSFEDLVKTIALVAEHGIVLSHPMALRKLAETSTSEKGEDKAKTGGISLLSKREQTVLSLVAQGLTNKEIATNLFISEHTVKVHLRNIMGKLQAHTRQQAVALAAGQSISSEAIKTAS